MTTNLAILALAETAASDVTMCWALPPLCPPSHTHNTSPLPPVTSMWNHDMVEHCWAPRRAPQRHRGMRASVMFAFGEYDPHLV